MTIEELEKHEASLRGILGLGYPNNEKSLLAGADALAEKIQREKNMQQWVVKDPLNSFPTLQLPKKRNITFHNSLNEIVGELSFETEELKFTGKADAAAKVFMDFLKKHFQVLFLKESLVNKNRENFELLIKECFGNPPSGFGKQDALEWRGEHYYNGLMQQFWGFYKLVVKQLL